MKKAVLLLFVVQTILSMEMVERESVKNDIFYLTALPFDLQRTIFQFVPKKSTFREINKEFSTTWSVKSPKIFANDVCGLGKQDIIKIILWASYQKNYAGVENILSKSSLLRLCPDKCIYYCYKTEERKKSTIEIHQMAIKYRKINNEFVDKRDEILLSLLKKYGIKRPQLTNFFWITIINKNIMVCLNGDSDAIAKKDSANIIKNQRIKIAFEVAVSCNNIKCIKKCLEIAQAYKDDHHVDNVFAVNPKYVAWENEYTKLLGEMCGIIGQHPHLHFLLDDVKDEKAHIDTEKLNKEREMTFLDWICTVF